MLILLLFTLQLTPPYSFHLLITENDDNSSDEDTCNKDAATAAADEDSADGRRQ